MQTLPSFDELHHLAEDDPERFEQLKSQLIQEFIQEAPQHLQPRLRGIQFQAEMQTRHSTNPVSRCITLSSMMFEALESLKQAISHPASGPRQKAVIYPLQTSPPGAP
ncbi:DUF3135 domain-containing protein [Aestuariirhabdus sp. Z084]|uniref:DUF3135 domain-containing protein n=1 Tax=Aestuariirhabdus haliotis TaxID=2918751 RepID=UPI00201B363A|nr:DUF3135 domain-containing protein [Aestuariirhabdus haliotis]MCL6415873.1 DUF3135 domain-containing protein [Aestuariirhabdus haliotis]MCL6419825.1 DUF3135 domain-containing protein [Aestuariirhabdus haliotis]